VRIRGTIGEWPVDLTIELDPQEWAQLARPTEQLPASTPQPAAAMLPAATKDDGPWRVACELLRTAGRMEGPELLEQLQGVTGDFGAAKRLLVRLRHHGQVRVFSEGETPMYVWQTDEKA